MAAPAAPDSFAPAEQAPNLRRQRRTVSRSEPQTARIEVDGRSCVDFCSNDYLDRKSVV